MTNDSKSGDDEAPINKMTEESNLAEENKTPSETPFPEVTIADLPPRLVAATERMGWTELTPVQAKAIPYLMSGRDLMAQARTGSGKTGAFIMPSMELINTRQDNCQALILTPTRELARQVAQEAQDLAGPDGMRVVAVYGGVKYEGQLEAFRRGAHLVVGTPGRVLDHLMQRSLSLDNLKVLVFDEADRMLSMGFYPDMRRVQTYLPKKGLYSFMFSATFPERVKSLARQFLKEPAFLSLSADHVHVAETAHVVYKVPAMDKDRALVRIIEIENPDSAIIFCNTKQWVHYVAVVLGRFGYDADELSGDVAQNERERVMGRLREGKLRFLVATDVAARGIDISNLSHVIQYEVPVESEIYIHRAGRTGRAGAAGEALTLVGERDEQIKIMRIGKKYAIDFEERPLPTDEDVTAVVAERTNILLEAKLRDRDKLKTERMQRFVPIVREWAEDEQGAKLMAMLLDDYYQQSLHPQPSESPKNQEKKQKSGGRRRRKRSRRR